MENPGKVGISFKNERHHLIQSMVAFCQGIMFVFFFFFRGSNTCIVKQNASMVSLQVVKKASLLGKLYD